MQQQTIRVTDFDSRRLQCPIEGTLSASIGRKATSMRPRVTPAAQIGVDVVTMNSEVVVADIDSGETFGFRVVFPGAAGTAAARISVLAPLGMAVRGRRMGQEVTWPVPAGVRRLRVKTSSTNRRKRAETSLEGSCASPERSQGERAHPLAGAGDGFVRPLGASGVSDEKRPVTPEILTTPSEYEARMTMTKGLHSLNPPAKTLLPVKADQ